MGRNTRKVFKRRIMLFLLIYTTFLTFCLMANTLSKYTAETGKSGDITIAKWDVDLLQSNSNGANIEIVAGNTEEEYQLTVSNNSETGVEYTITISNLPTGTEVKLDNGEYKKETGGEVRFNNVLDANHSGNKTHKLTFKAEIGVVPSSNNNVKIDIDFIQQEPN